MKQLCHRFCLFALLGIAPAMYATTFQTLNNANDLTFNQLLGINDSGVIGGYFASGNVVAETHNTLGLNRKEVRI